MFTKTAFLAALAGLASASPCKPSSTGTSNTTSTIEPTSTSTSTVTPFPTDAKFSLMAIRSGSTVHYQPFGAALASIFAGLPSQNASCDAGAQPNYATFSLTSDGEIYLYTDNPPQRLFADRSGMGQGKLGYVTGAEPLGRYWETASWEIDSVGDVTFNGAGLIACPDSIDGAWSIWVDAGVANPAGNENCEGIVARAVEIEDPVKCAYTE